MSQTEARPRHDLTRSSYAIRLLVLLSIGTMLSGSRAATGAASYWISLQGGTQQSSSALRDSLHWATPGVAPTIIDENAYAEPGHVGARVHLLTAWPFEFAASGSGNAGAGASTDNFVIVGPPGAMSVQGVLYFHAKVRLDRGGGLPGSEQHIAQAMLHVSAANLSADGTCWSSNFDAGADGVLAGQTPPVIDAIISLPGRFPVGEPFLVSMEIDAQDQTYGDSSVSPGFTETDASTDGVTIGDADGRVMDLPPGYTAYSLAWDVRDNLADAPDVGAAGLVLASVAPNPSAGSVHIRYVIPSAGDVSIAVIDLQGRLVRQVVSGPMGAGPHGAAWDGRNDSGTALPAGLYFVALSCGGQTITDRIVRIR